MHKSVKRGLITVAAAVGFTPVDRQWMAALVRLEGTFERGVSDLAIYVALLIFIAVFTLGLGGFAIKEYRLLGWTPTATFFTCLCLVFLCLSYMLASRVGLRYVFALGTINAFNTWGQLMWSEDLRGVTSLACFSGRGMTSMMLRWSDRKRSLELFNSLRDALDASVESSKLNLGSDAPTREKQ